MSSQDIIDEQNNVTSIGQLANDKKTVFIDEMVSGTML